MDDDFLLGKMVENPTYSPYCLRCQTMERMQCVASFYRRCRHCGAECDLRPLAIERGKLTELQIFLEREYMYVRLMPGTTDTYIALRQMMYTTGLHIIKNQWSYEYRYCFEHHGDALIAIATWTGIGHPPGPWIKRKGVGGELTNPERHDDATSGFETE